MAGKKTHWNAYVSDDLTPIACSVAPSGIGGYTARLVLFDELGQQYLTSESHLIDNLPEAQSYADATAVTFGLVPS